MATIKLQNGEVSAKAVQGFTGTVPCKIWSCNGSKALLDKILERNAHNSAAFVLGPTIMGLSDRAEKGGQHSARTRRKIIEANHKRKGSGKQDKQYNVPQSLAAVRATRFAKAGRAKKGTGKQEQKFNVRQARGYVGPLEQDKARRDVVKATKVRME